MPLRLLPEREEERAISPRREAVGRMKLLERELRALVLERGAERNEPVPLVARALREVRAPPVNDPVRRPLLPRVCGRDQPVPPRREDDCESRLAAVPRLPAVRVAPR